MECNKGEAIRSRDIAEQKFLSHDLMGAKKFALKAQHLFPGLEGLPQLLAVLDVHIVAQDKVHGADANWYGILQTHATADDATIRKQYRKLALILHPDKNKAVGADGAFKLISEAWGVLSDKGKKAAHDERRERTVRPADGFCNFTNFSTRSWPQPKPVKKTATFCIMCPSCQNQFQCLRAQENDMVLCMVCHQAFAVTEACRTNGDSFCRTTENFKSRCKSSVTPIPQGKPDFPHMGGSASIHSPNKADDSRLDGSPSTEDSKWRGKSSAMPIPLGKPADGPHMGGLASTPSANKADDSLVDGSTSTCCGPDVHHMGVPDSSHCGSDELHGNKKWNARPDEAVNVRVTGDASQQHSDQLADGTSISWQSQEGQPDMYGSCPKARNTHWHSTFQFHWGSHRNRTASDRSPTAVKATVEMVQDVYETVRRERVRAQKTARDKAMKERIEAEKEARRQELREQREQKRRRKEEELKKQAKAALHAKIAFDKLFARQHNASVEDTNIRSKAGFECKTDAHEAGIVNINSQGDHSDIGAVSSKERDLE